jgi:hypothetical protein
VEKLRVNNNSDKNVGKIKRHRRDWEKIPLNSG